MDSTFLPHFKMAKISIQGQLWNLKFYGSATTLIHTIILNAQSLRESQFFELSQSLIIFEKSLISENHSDNSWGISSLVRRKI